MRWCVIIMGLLLGVTTAGATGQELTERPDALLKPVNVRTASVYGVRLGDAASAIPREVITRTNGDYVDLRGGWRIRQRDGRVKALIATQAAAAVWDALGITEESDVQFVLGKAEDVHVVETATKTFRDYNYYARRLRVEAIATNTETTMQVVVR